MRILLFLAIFFVIGSCKDQNKKSDPDETNSECDKSLEIENTHTIEGYLDKESYFPGDSIHFKIHSLTNECQIEIIRHGATDNSIATIYNVPTQQQNYNCRSYSYGCDWNTTFSYQLPANLNSGIYSARLSNALNEEFYICFVVKGVGSAPFAVLANTNTWESYNSWGGQSFYQYDLSENRNASSIISFDRPNIATDPNGNKGHLVEAELHLLRWMENNNFDYHSISDRDIHDGKVNLYNYETLVLNVHPEYWTYEMRFMLEEYMESGGNVINLGANCIYWKAEIEDNKIEKEIKKGETFYLGDGKKGGKWRQLGKPESELLGVEYDTRGYNTYAPYKVYKASHWIFNGTNLNDGDLFGSNCLNGDGASGHETDKMTPHSPPNTIFLAKGTNPNNGGGSMVYYEYPSGRKVFSAGSITFTGSLSVDSVCHQIALNVFNAFQ